MPNNYTSDIEKQQNFAPELKDHIPSAIDLVVKTVKVMSSHLSQHIKRRDDREVSRGAHEYWQAYFGYRKFSTGELFAAGFGYDLRQWKEEPDSTLPPWRIYFYQYGESSDITAIQNICRKYRDNYEELPTDNWNQNPQKLWIPIPKEFVYGLNEESLPEREFLLAGAVNAFIGSIV
jgi:hypothetical protein